jgi:AAA15 family ATPase/GTPase
MVNEESDKLSLKINSIQLKGYKSIDDLSVSLEHGLNILIGRNASGKSNFLECVYSSIVFLTGTPQFKFAKIEFVANDSFIMIWERKKMFLSHESEDGNPQERSWLKDSLHVNGELVFESGYQEISLRTSFDFQGRKIISRNSVRSIFRQMGFYFLAPIYIRFNIPELLVYLTLPGTINIPIGEDSDYSWSTPTSLNWINRFFWIIEDDFFTSNSSVEKITKQSFLKRLGINQSIKDNLKKLTPIKDIRFNENVNIYKTDTQIIIENLRIDFKVNDSWIPWSQLSDGTKRLFYMISEITDQDDGFVLLEEPELGIHPHQFHLIMNFLKEQSETKQIIISTHSPQSLDTLSKEELDNISIAYFDSKKGSKVKKLNTRQKNKAIKYMDEVGFLSDYWMLSDLES